MPPPLASMNFASFQPRLCKPQTLKCQSDAFLIRFLFMVLSPSLYCTSGTTLVCLSVCTASSGSSAPLQLCSAATQPLEAAPEPMACASVSLCAPCTNDVSCVFFRVVDCHVLLLFTHLFACRCVRTGMRVGHRQETRRSSGFGHRQFPHFSNPQV